MRDVLRLKRNFLNLAAKKRGLLLAIAVLLLLFLSLQGQWSQSYAADKTQVAQKETTYPATPEGVVKSEHKMQYERDYVSGKEPEHYYWSKELYCQSDMSSIINSFNVKKLSQTEDKAKVQVVFEIIGIFSLDANIEKAEKKDFDIFRESNRGYDIGIIVYELVKKNNHWRIVPRDACQMIYISIDAAIKFIEEGQKFRKNSIERNINQENIDFLKNLKNKK